MFLASSLAFFLVIFLLASILTAIAYLAFLKMKADESDAEHSDLTLSKPLDSARNRAEGREELGFGIEPSPLLQSGRLSSITFWDTMLAHFDFGAMLQSRLDQADLRWSVGRITSMMLLVGVIVLAVLMRLAAVVGGISGSGGGHARALRLCSASPHQTLHEVSRKFSRRSGFSRARVARGLSAFRRHGNDR